MKKMKVIGVLAATLMTTGCATSMVDAIQSNVAQQHAQAKRLFEIAQNPANISDDGALQAKGVVARIEVEEVEKASTTARSLSDGFGGTIVSLSADVVDTALPGEIVEVTNM
jgi:hypothetical protein